MMYIIFAVVCIEILFHFILRRDVSNMEVRLTGLIVSLSRNTPILPPLGKEMKDKLKYYTDEELYDIEKEKEKLENMNNIDYSQMIFRETILPNIERSKNEKC